MSWQVFDSGIKKVRKERDISSNSISDKEQAEDQHLETHASSPIRENPM